MKINGELRSNTITISDLNELYFQAPYVMRLATDEQLFLMNLVINSTLFAVHG